MGFYFLLTYSLPELKTFTLMAKFELKFIDFLKDSDFIRTEVEKINGAEYIRIFGRDTTFSNEEEDMFEIYLDKSTAIKFAKTLRTEINKITESEGTNG